MTYKCIKYVPPLEVGGSVVPSANDSNYDMILIIRIAASAIIRVPGTPRVRFNKPVNCMNLFT